jgi:hypothetical protein
MATAVESKGFWYQESVQIETEHELRCDLPPAPPEPPVVTGTVAGVALKIKATGLSCPSSHIFNEGSKAKGKGSLKLTGVTVVEPAGCVIEGGTIETAELAAQVWMEGSKALVRFAPAAGSTAVFAKIPISKCAVAGTYSMKGSVFAEMASATGVAGTSQVMKFSGAINSAAGGSLTLAEKPATLTIEDTSKIEEGTSVFSVKES